MDWESIRQFVNVNQHSAYPSPMRIQKAAPTLCDHSMDSSVKKGAHLALMQSSETVTYSAVAMERRPE